MKKILIPTDVSELGNYAYEMAHQIAGKTGAVIEVLAIVPAPAEAYFDLEGNLKNDQGEDFTAFIQQQEILEQQLKKWVANKADIQSVKVKIGRVDEDIVHYAKKNQIDLIVMGTAGASGINEILRGSHAAHAVNRAQAPVLSVKCDRSDMLIKDILLVGDFEKIEVLNLKVIKDLRDAFGAKLHLLRVNTSTQFETNQKVMLNMQKFAELNELEQVEFHLYCDESVEQGIVHFSSDNRIDFVAIGTHQRTGLSRLFKHSISEDIVNHVWQPILTFPV
jgi:nucleotide-binding universal stress UspA family protein